MTTIMKKTFVAAFIALLLFVPGILQAHAPNQSYIFLRIYDKSVGGRFEITIKDINTALGLDLDENINLEQLKPYLTQIQAYVSSHASFGSEGKSFQIVFTDTDLVTLPNLGAFIHLNFDLAGVSTVPKALDVDYSILLEKDSQHQGLLVIEYNWKAGIINNEAMVSLIFTDRETSQQLQLSDASVMQGFISMIKMGMWHIWIGLDHIFFLVALLLPAVVRSKPGGGAISNGIINGVQGATPAFILTKNSWVPVERFQPAFLYVLKIVTFFTIAHTITLSLAALEIIVLPSRFVESVIAFSIALAAYHNVRPIVRNEVWIIAFGFGLFHGFGFASVLGEKGLGGDYMTLSLLGFNLGVEIGQVLIICLIFPVLFFLRESPHYPKILVYGSGILILIAFYWFVERVFEVDFLLDNYIGVAVNKVLRLLNPWK